MLTALIPPPSTARPTWNCTWTHRDTYIESCTVCSTFATLHTHSFEYECIYYIYWRAGASQPSRSTGTIFHLPVLLTVVTPPYIPPVPFLRTFLIFSYGCPCVSCRNVLRISKYTTNDILHHAVLLHRPAVQAFMPAVQAFMQAVNTFMPVVQAFMPAVQAFMQAVNTFMPVVQAFMPAVQAFMQAVNTFMPVVQAFMQAIQPFMPVVQGLSTRLSNRSCRLSTHSCRLSTLSCRLSTCMYMQYCQCVHAGYQFSQTWSGTFCTDANRRDTMPKQHYITCLAQCVPTLHQPFGFVSTPSYYIYSCYV